MEYGYLPPVPKQVAKDLEEIAVQKEKVLTAEDIEKVDDIVKWFKRIDHGEVKSITGEEFDKKLKDAKYIIEKITKIIDKLRDKEGKLKPVIDKDLLKQADKEVTDKYMQKEE
jgi:16S rRNA C1402 (ribose-2'-O) methylase RsmI